MMKSLLLLPLLITLTACQALQGGMAKRTARAAGDATVPLVGQFDNHEQVWSARQPPAAAILPPHVVATLGSTSDPAWSTWQIHLDAAVALDALWAVQRVVAADGSTSLLPYRALVVAPATGAAFDPKQWAPLDACALRGEVGPALIRVAAEPSTCGALAPGLGAAASLLPLAIEREGEWLRLRLFVDQTRGADAREEARKVETYTGWAAVNGAGPNATDNGNDWHMDRTLRLGSEGGRAALTWRDGKPSGYSLVLERLTYRDGNVAVLKLSLLEDASGRTLAYAWANPQATRIGLSLGWVQVGLQREGADATAH